MFFATLLAVCPVGTKSPPECLPGVRRKTKNQWVTELLYIPLDTTTILLVRWPVCWSSPVWCRDLHVWLRWPGCRHYRSDSCEVQHCPTSVSCWQQHKQHVTQTDKYFWHNLASNVLSISHLTQRLFLHYLQNAEQAECVLKWTKTSKNISNITDFNLKQKRQILIIFGRNVPLFLIQMTVQVPTWRNASALPEKNRKSKTCTELNKKDPQLPGKYNLWLSCSSVSIRLCLGMIMSSRSDLVKSGLIWCRTSSTLQSTHREVNVMPVFA